MAWVWLVVLGVCVHIIYLSMMVGKARATYNIEAPATTGDLMFDRHYRAHLNSIEQSVIFFPLLAVCAFTGSTVIASILGGIYLIGRIVYAAGYVKEPGKRGTGMIIGFLAQVGLLLVGAYNVVVGLI
jgi:glutathione S-transferase